ncbi:MAG: hypothetical protein HZB42_11325 [Sphingobacteriales bacterium]|nr:hypothetical protein [Sphingobacteriales bacterium]
MGTEKKPGNKSRRQFFFSLFAEKKEKIKMLTADGKLVEVDKTAFEQVSKKKKASNKEVYDWMKNPSKNKN